MFRFPNKASLIASEGRLAQPEQSVMFRRTPRRGKHVAAVLRLVTLAALPLMCSSDQATTSQTISVTIAPAGKLSVPSALPLIGSGAGFSPYSGSLSISYRVRTTPGMSGGTITLQASSDFAPAGGPQISSGALKYACSGASLGSACSGTQTVSTAAQTPVVSIPPAACTGGGAPCSASDPNVVQLQFVLDNDPQYSTGTYSAQVVFVISTT